MTVTVKGVTSIGIAAEYAGLATFLPVVLVAAAVLAWIEGPGWAGRAPVAGVVGYLAAVVIVGAAWLLRFWSISVHFADHGVTVHNFWRTHRLAWQDVARFTDGFRGGLLPESEPRWALAIVARDGRVITAAATAFRHKHEIPEMLAEIRRIAMLHMVRVRVTGDPYGEWLAHWSR